MNFFLLRERWNIMLHRMRNSTHPEIRRPESITSVSSCSETIVCLSKSLRGRSSSQGVAGRWWWCCLGVFVCFFFNLAQKLNTRKLSLGKFKQTKIIQLNFLNEDSKICICYSIKERGTRETMWGSIYPSLVGWNMDWGFRRKINPAFDF